TAPKPEIVAGVAPFVPGIENRPSVILLPTGTKSRGELNVVNVVPYVELPKNPTRPLSGPPLGGACTKPVPGVTNCPPRVFVKTLNGVPPGALVLTPPPSQLISRRPPPSGPGALALFGLPNVF